jgi:uncharacterized protein
MDSIGKVARLRRYPVKSMMGEDLQTAVLEPYGVVGDRVYAFVMDNAPNPKFPWMTAREVEEMLLYSPTSLSDFGVEVQSPDGSKFPITHIPFEKLIEEKSGRQISLIHRQSGCHDSKPVSILGLQTIKKLSSEMGAEDLAQERFRANIYGDWDSGEPFLEDTLLDRELSIGKNQVRLKIVKKDSRCVIPTLDPVTAISNPLVLETIKSRHNGCFGVYAEVVYPGTIKLGDSISVV